MLKRISDTTISHNEWQSVHPPQALEVSSLNQVEFYDLGPEQQSFKEEVLMGLGGHPKTLPAKFFYDERGCALFDEICELPEYYPTRTETSILKRCVGDMSTLIGPGSLLIEYGSGNSLKTHILLDALQPSCYIPIEIAREQLSDVSAELSVDYPDTRIIAICADYSKPLMLPRTDALQGSRLVFFPGSTIGNFTPEEALCFLRNARNTCLPNGGLLIGVDLKKNSAMLNAAYNDAKGVTAQFNLNILERINRELKGSFDLENFSHRAFYNENLGRVEMHLLSLQNHTVHIENHPIEFVKGETIHTENSYKYSIPEFKAMAIKAGFEPVQVWTDSAHLFSVHYLHARAYQ